ncbi:CheR family methyltransferase [Maridesulfovibrio hydrothermalis]|uniref:MCP methyltransferase, CheR-type n=1 Tax=Maridesulfovibrio hydrothermalis AM13 = DSM 14728 TaxID=1121451 RepID=L0RG22_9BACT|nr:protein-glutamate O-methyltransferase CheR [Maridesulfovibrio hydrothermalis]CCO25160.1 MCP methyltransferase, CheR-type [Maridesulfovibrio hydrothermalis AM13 = DSM 14728]
MVNSLTDDKVSQLACMVRDKYGLDFAPDRWRDLRLAIENFQTASTCFCASGDCLDYMISPQAARKDLELFINSLTIGETYFFRDPRALDVLERDILRKKNGQGSGTHGAMRIWSMACATGEEPYTLAMICRRSNVRCEIFGTDIDSRALTKAHEGSYRKWSFRSESTVFRDMFFKKSGPNAYFIDQSIKDMVNLSRFNLIGDDIPLTLMEMDVIFCRNVLMYFSREGVNMVLDKIWNSLNSGGWLVVTPSESALITAYGKFEAVNFGSVVFYRKNEKFIPEKIKILNSVELEKESVLSDVDLIEEQDCFSGADHGEFDFSADPLVQEEESVTDTDDLSKNDFDETLSISGNFSVKVCNDQVRLLREQGDNAGALNLLKETLRLEISRVDRSAVLLSIAEINADGGLLDEALEWCQRSIELDRVAPYPHFLLGQIMMQQGDFAGAVAEVRNAIFLDSGFIMAHVVLGNIYMTRNDASAAARHFRISLQELEKVDQEELVPYSDGTTAGRLLEMVELVQSNLEQKEV